MRIVENSLDERRVLICWKARIPPRAHVWVIIFFR